MSYHSTPKRQKAARGAIGSYIYEGVRRIGSAAVGGFVRKAAGGARNLGSDFAEAAESYITNASHQATSAVRGAAERLASSMAGGASMNIGDNAVVPAQLIPGRGAELSYQQLNICKAIKFKTGEGVGPELTDAFARERMLYKGQSAMHAFAFKMQLVPPSYATEADSVPINRFYVHNVFRHVLAGPNNASMFNQGAPYGAFTQSWNETLGPDKSAVRSLGATTMNDSSKVGSAYTVPSAAQNLNSTLTSPYRYPKNGGWMFSRMSRMLMENLGWNANPMKLVSIDAGIGGLTPTALLVYPNALSKSDQGIVSSPNTAPADSNGITGPSYYYRNQCGRGQVSYCFNNDGTNPIVVDIVITRIKKGQQIIKGDLHQLENAYKRGYLNYSFANDGQADLNGQPPSASDVLTNARCPFLPAKALDCFKRTTNAGGANINTGSHPFKQVARDQFIIAGGASRNWSTYLQSLDYDARKFAQQQSSLPALPVPPSTPGGLIAGYDDQSNCLDEFSYVFSIAVSGVPAPYIEFAGTAGSVASVIDRRGTDCSVSVTGAYKESPHPVYLTQALKPTYINGRLDIPGYDNAATGLSITTNDIANIGQATRSAANSTALIGMGPLNTVGGG